MYVVRPMTHAELDVFQGFANRASLGITSMPKNRALLEKKIAHSVDSFSKQVETPGNELYLFVAEEKDTHKIAGVSAILARQGFDAPCYFYAIETVKEPRVLHTLNPITISKGPTELCSLYLDPDIRHGGIGKLLSLSRFLFLASFPQRFEKTVAAELRGYFDKEGHSPFWEGLGRRFYDRDFNEVMNQLEKGKEFIPSLLPKFPIYIELLPKEVQESIGKVHEHTQAAYNILTRQGFALTNHVDIFDGGPTIRAEREKLTAFTKSKRVKVASVAPVQDTTEKLIAANERLAFRACYASARTLNGDQVQLDPESAKALEVQAGDFIRVISIEEKKA